MVDETHILDLLKKGQILSTKVLTASLVSESNHKAPSKTDGKKSVKKKDKTSDKKFRKKSGKK